MGLINDTIRFIKTSSSKELGIFLEEMNKATFQDCEWNATSVKAANKKLLDAIDSEWGNMKMMWDCGNAESEVYDCASKEKYTVNVYQAMTNLKAAYEFFLNPPTVENPNSEQVSVDVETIDWSKPIYTTDDLKKLLNISDNTLRKWLNGGWIAYTQMDGSDKKLIAKEDLMAFLKNPKIFYPSSK